MPQDIDKGYWKRAREGLELCLNCPLLPHDCVHMPTSRPGDICPIDGTVSRVATPDKYTTRRQKALQKAAQLLAEEKALTMAAVAAEIGIGGATITAWERRGYLVFQRSPEKGPIKKILVGVNL